MAISFLNKIKTFRLKWEGREDSLRTKHLYEQIRLLDKYDQKLRKIDRGYAKLSDLRRASDRRGINNLRYSLQSKGIDRVEINRRVDVLRHKQFNARNQFVDSYFPKYEELNEQYKDEKTNLQKKQNYERRQLDAKKRLDSAILLQGNKFIRGLSGILNAIVATKAIHGPITGSYKYIEDERRKRLAATTSYSNYRTEFLGIKDKDFLDAVGDRATAYGSSKDEYNKFLGYITSVSSALQSGIGGIEDVHKFAIAGIDSSKLQAGDLKGFIQDVSSWAQTASLHQKQFAVSQLGISPNLVKLFGDKALTTPGGVGKYTVDQYRAIVESKYSEAYEQQGTIAKIINSIAGGASSESALSVMQHLPFSESLKFVAENPFSSLGALWRSAIESLFVPSGAVGWIEPKGEIIPDAKSGLVTYDINNDNAFNMNITVNAGSLSNPGEIGNQIGDAVITNISRTLNNQNNMER